MKKTKADLGDLVKCKITNLQGIVTSYATHLTGCDRVFIQPPVDKEGKTRDGWWIDIDTAEVMKKGKVKMSDVTGAKNGGPMSRVK